MAGWKKMAYQEIAKSEPEQFVFPDKMKNGDFVEGKFEGIKLYKEQKYVWLCGEYTHYKISFWNFPEVQQEQIKTREKELIGKKCMALKTQDRRLTFKVDE